MAAASELINTLPPHAAAFLSTCGWSNCRITPLPADASTRVYFRLERRVKNDEMSGDTFLGVETCLLMFDPPPATSLTQYRRIAALLQDLGLSSPRIFIYDETIYLALIEDFGDSTVNRSLDLGHPEEDVYDACMTTLIALQTEISALPYHSQDLPLYAIDLALSEMQQFIEWYYPAVAGHPLPTEARAAFESLWCDAWPTAMEALPLTLTCRDFHVENIILVPERSGAQACGLIDFQDAVWGPPAYDPVSLLQDARRDVSLTVEDAMKQRIISEMQWDPEAFERSYQLLGAQRNTKILGFCVRMWRQQKKAKYLPYIPRVWMYLLRNLAHPDAAALKAWYDTWLPATHRYIPAELAPE